MYTLSYLTAVPCTGSNSYRSTVQHTVTAVYNSTVTVTIEMTLPSCRRLFTGQPVIFTTALI